MRSANSALAALALALAAGCGNYGNGPIDDAVYLNALPKTEDLRFSVPKDSSSPLCALGSSKTAGDTHDFATMIELSVEGILKIIDFIRIQPPTARDASSRTWGPWPDGPQLGVWDRVKMQRIADDHFTFVLEQRKGVDGQFLTLLSADLFGSRATKGHGSLHFDYAASAQMGTGNPLDPKLGFLDIVYDAASDPRTIDLKTREVPSPFAISVAAYQDGQMRLDLDYLDANGAHLTAASKFLPSGAGASRVRGQAGPFDITISECWDPTYCRSYFLDLAGWTRPPCTGAFCELGNVASCPSTLHGGLPFP